MSKTFEVISHYRKAGAVLLARLDSQAEAVARARDTAIGYVETGGDFLIAITVVTTTTRKTLSTFYPDRYEADCLDDDDDG